MLLCLILITRTKKTGYAAGNECNDERMLNVLKNDKFESILTQHGTFSIVQRTFSWSIITREDAEK